jgi:hypothetical protein
MYDREKQDALALDAETTVYGPGAFQDGDERVAVKFPTQGLELVLFFDDLAAEGPALEIRVVPRAEPLEPKVLRRVMPEAPLYADYARAQIQMNLRDAITAAAALRKLGRTRRGLGDDFYRLVAQNYAALVKEGVKHPVTALGDMHHVTTAAASRWIKEARRRGYIDEREAVPT